MVSSKKNIAITNTFFNLALQAVSIISGFIIPRIILVKFGSDVNGLISSLSQMLNFVTLLDGGIGGIIITALYRPIREHDTKKISSIVKTASNFYRKILVVFLIYALLLSVLYPLIFNTDFSLPYISSLTLILSISLVIQYGFSLPFKNLLIASKRVYIVAITQIVVIVSNVIIAYLVATLFPDIHLLKILTGLTFVAQPILYSYYVKKYYHLDKNIEPDKNLIKNRWSGLALNIAYFIHNNTDIVILSYFTDLATVSVYTVYALATTGIKNVILAVTASISPSLGHIYAEGDSKKTTNFFNLYEFIIFFTSFLLFTLTYLLIVPFVSFFTQGVTDANYYQPIFALLLVIAELICVLREPHINLSYAADKFKEITPFCWTEAIINIVVSVVLVNVLGLIGIIIGTLLAVTVRTIFHIFYTKQLINRPIRIFIKRIIVFTLAAFLSVLACQFIGRPTSELLSWISFGLVYALITGSIMLAASSILFREETIELLKYIKTQLLHR